MTTWVTVLVACALAYVLKLAGYAVPARWVQGERTARVTTLLPVALLAALIVTQTLAGREGLVVDARLVAAGAAIVLLALRANFLVVVGGAALVAALLRALGWG